VNTRKLPLLKIFEVHVVLLKLRSTTFLQLSQLCNLWSISYKSRKSSAVPHVLALPPHCLSPAKCHGLDCWEAAWCSYKSKHLYKSGAL